MITTAINPEELSDSDEHVIRPSIAQFVEVISIQGKSARATAHVFVEVKSNDEYGAYQLFVLTLTRRVGINKSGEIKYIEKHVRHVPSCFIEPETEEKQYVVLGLLGGTDHSSDVTIRVDLTQRFNSIVEVHEKSAETSSDHRLTATQKGETHKN